MAAGQLLPDVLLQLVRKAEIDCAFLMLQGWLSVWVTLITVVSVLFFTYISGGRTQVTSSLPPRYRGFSPCNYLHPLHP